MQTEPTRPDRTLTLTDGECIALFRATIEYKRLLGFSLLRGFDAIIERELNHIARVEEKVSLAAFYPEDDFGTGGDGE